MSDESNASEKCNNLVEFALFVDFKMRNYRTVHFLNKQVQETAFEKHNLNKIGATKIFIGEISIPSLISSLIVKKNKKY